MRWVLSVALVVVIQSATLAQDVGISEYAQQNEAFKRWWGQPLEWNFDKLPLEGDVPDWRIPYSGHDYPDRQGGTIDSLRKYDIAFRNGGQASSWEQWDTTAYKERPREGQGFLGRLFAGRPRTPDWHGHCNGWTAAAIRHAEPQKSVTVNGVTFSPADIKGLLAEIYMYQDVEFLGGVDEAINPAIFHAVLTNWLGRGEHPIGTDTTLGKEVWNYPIYSYKATSHKHSPRLVEVAMNFVYAKSTKQEFDESPHLAEQVYMHYQLDLDARGNIIGGRYYRDSSKLDILWAPVAPADPGKAGNERGNPYVDIDQVLSIWRASVPKEERNKWLTIDPVPADAVVANNDDATPTQIRVQSETTSSGSTEVPTVEPVPEAEAPAPVVEDDEAVEPIETATPDNGVVEEAVDSLNL